MPGPEARYQKTLIDALRARGAWVVKYPAGPHGTIGTPDLLGCYRGRFFCIECKQGNPQLARYAPTEQQQRQLDAAFQAGAISLVAWPGNHDQVLAVFDDLDQLFDAVAEQ